MKGKILVTIQFVSLALLLMFTNWILLPLWTYIPVLFSALLAFWAAGAMKPGNFNIVPYPVKNGVMISRGPYRLIRHPMYASILIFSFGLLAGQFDYKKLLVSVVLMVCLVIKMYFEEKLLCAHHPGYKAYIQKTKRIIPFIW